MKFPPQKLYPHGLAGAPQVEGGGGGGGGVGVRVGFGLGLGDSVGRGVAGFVGDEATVGLANASGFPPVRLPVGEVVAPEVGEELSRTAVSSKSAATAQPSAARLLLEDSSCAIRLGTPHGGAARAALEGGPIGVPQASHRRAESATRLPHFGHTGISLRPPQAESRPLEVQDSREAA